MIIEFIIAFATYFAIVYGAYYVTEIKRLPQWLQFPPFDCRKCLTFWSLMIIGLVIGFSFDLPIYMGTIVCMAILTAVSMHIDQKNKTVKIDPIDPRDYDEYYGEDVKEIDGEYTIEVGDKIIEIKPVDKDEMDK